MNRPLVVIVDDEKNIANFFYKIVSNYFFCDIKCEVFYFSNDVIDFGKNNLIDLLICDIDMPIIDGIELAKALRKINKNLEIIFLTGMNNFENAYKALKIENVSYILKIDADEQLNETINKKLIKIRKNKESLIMLKNITNEKNVLQEQVVSSELKKILINDNISKKQKANFESGYLFYLNMSETNLDIVFETNDIIDIIKSKIEICIGEIISLSEFEFVFLLHCLKNKNIDVILEEISRIIINKYHVSSFFVYTDYLVESDLFRETLLNIIQYAKGLDILNEQIVIKKISIDNQVMKTIANDARQLNEIKKYIWDNLSNDVSLNSISKHLGYNASYLSRLFKNKYNKNIKDFIIEIKISKAKHLLEDTDLFVKDISQSLGFDSISHFFHVFKKYTGFTPNEYRAHQYQR